MVLSTRSVTQCHHTPVAAHLPGPAPRSLADTWPCAPPCLARVACAPHAGVQRTRSPAAAGAPAVPFAYVSVCVLRVCCVESWAAAWRPQPGLRGASSGC
eukprot:1156035-Pelagomonas_calceolata.AAC.4